MCAPNWDHLGDTSPLTLDTTPWPPPFVLQTCVSFSSMKPRTESVGNRRDRARREFPDPSAAPRNPRPTPTPTRIMLRTATVFALVGTSAALRPGTVPPARRTAMATTTGMSRRAALLACQHWRLCRARPQQLRHKWVPAAAAAAFRGRKHWVVGLLNCRNSHRSPRVSLGQRSSNVSPLATSGSTTCCKTGRRRQRCASRDAKARRMRAVDAGVIHHRPVLHGLQIHGRSSLSCWRLDAAGVVVESDSDFEKFTIAMEKWNNQADDGNVMAYVSS